MDEVVGVLTDQGLIEEVQTVEIEEALVSGCPKPAGSGCDCFPHANQGHADDVFGRFMRRAAEGRDEADGDSGVPVAEDAHESDHARLESSGVTGAAYHVDAEFKRDEGSGQVADHSSGHRIHVTLAAIAQAGQMKVQPLGDQGRPRAGGRVGADAVGKGRTVGNPARPGIGRRAAEAAVVGQSLQLNGGIMGKPEIQRRSAGAYVLDAGRIRIWGQ